MAVEVKGGMVFFRGANLKPANVGLRVKFLKTTAWMLKAWGGLVMALSVVGGLWIYGPLLTASFKFLISNVKTNPKTQIQTQSKAETKPVSEVKKGVTWEVPDWNYSIYIPKIGAVSRIVPDVDAGNKKEYLAALKEGVAEARGLAHPGEVGTTFLFAHSVGDRADFARYNAVFYLLGEMEPGDDIEVVYKGKLSRYKVEEILKLEARDTRYLVPQKKEELLVLQTCWPPGTSWKRLVLTARPSVLY
ncbi:hypothetical protein A2899_05140 [Candidatus Amesbacteria bacterium RIFCSPLOWO2_01_FULL_49_25]|uniref:Sortase n=1 Tax=Candidatus Amesbacteria bacterium RIFCSPHIGHO2_01_FULL_48_32b TaxID=1797253 RepID=A0A1F4YF72_9BACT|nr:MAG: hypothetical protein A2876_02890 [Candidatus Amesbacteria bacterium RIFCSPHIGHO2_01_FULL_48_32b]OGD07813.1 MAG: hypothetical protein A2899_05140 [Candidatus Amesbacteria bacterium RIFCSPLOWO2_01_FULL_49_25]